MISCDTNLVVYAHDNRDLAKQLTARDILAAAATARAAIGLQVVGEVQNALRKRLRVPAHVAYGVASDLLTEFETFAYDEQSVAIALAEANAGRLSYWDALLLAAADRAGVQMMLSEDMADGFVFGGLEVLNPFGAGSGPSARIRKLLAL